MNASPTFRSTLPNSKRLPNEASSAICTTYRFWGNSCEEKNGRRIPQLQTVPSDNSHAARYFEQATRREHPPQNAADALIGAVSPVCARRPAFRLRPEDPVPAQPNRKLRFHPALRPTFRTLAAPWILRLGIAKLKTPFSFVSALDFSYFGFALDTPSRHSQIENCVFICLCSRLFVSLPI